MDFLDALAIMVSSALVFAAPLIFTAIGGVFSERSGIINIGLEGLMVMGAFVGIVFNLTFSDMFGSMTPWISMLAAMVLSAIFALVHAVASITFRADQVVSGVAINFLALGVGLFLTREFYDRGQTDIISNPFYTWDVPFLSDIPVLGRMFFENYPSTYLAIAVALLGWFVLFKTSFGLRLRAVGEHPMAADTNGIKVYRMRYIAVMISGAMGGLGGAAYALTVAQAFSQATIVGQGFMSLAAVIFGKWHPLGALGAAIFFGFAQAISINGASWPLFANIPQVFLLILPYALTILALAGFIGRAEAPKSLGTPYIKGSR
ncbi:MULTISPECIES: ABC transporter permease [Salimicrobium]|uniref:Sugar ABC transporter permease n=4 Tax=Salimicrobium TaxID=351195 RepID=K2HB04_9BACI|nr:MULTISPECIES: ABC transporter permease [Salimicrobium]AKG04529.1 sugar ABC transporter permease [Salimicrobium jeotgali]EKE32740.1 sugar ABC transporter permease [Salimicrobium jeotgali]MBM7695272.1 simple sugar transport system permease protein [Salimicrobium jeotgali]PBB05919.1 ABC transporter permease [Salimicrobium humidisoli]SDX29784.1 nucleoside ABC transporter membrane protein [Salimicrobium album]